MLTFTIHDLNGFARIRPVFFRSDPKRESFFVWALVFTTMGFLLAPGDWFRPANLGNGLIVGSGFNRGNGFNPGNEGTAGTLFERVVLRLSGT